MQEPSDNISLKFNSFYVSKIYFDISSIAQEDVKPEATTNISTKIHIYNGKVEVVKLELVLLLNSKPFLQVEAIGEFEIIGEFTNDELKKHPLILYNSPAIIYPFLRSFIATLTANLGYLTTIYLPIINFYNLPEPQVIFE